MNFHIPYKFNTNLLQKETSNLRGVKPNDSPPLRVRPCKNAPLVPK